MMLDVRTLVTTLELSPTDLQAVLLQLASDRWTPAVLESERTFLRLAGVADKISQPVRQSENYAMAFRRAW